MKLRAVCWIVLAAVLALGAPAWADKVMICHDPGKPNNSHTISVNEDAVQAHLDHGDTLGTCAGATCPCWTAEDLLRFTPENFLGYPLYCTYLKDSSGNYTSMRDTSLFLALIHYDTPYFCKIDTLPDDVLLTRDEAEVCRVLAFDRCDAIGYPVIKP